MWKVEVVKCVWWRKKMFIGNRVMCERGIWKGVCGWIEMNGDGKVIWIGKIWENFWGWEIEI